MQANGQIVARYCEPDGTVTDQANENGSVANIAAVSNRHGNVVGLMPHPERATNDLIGGSHGLKLLRSVLSAQGVTA